MTLTTAQLDELERKARAVTPGGLLDEDQLRWSHQGWSARTRSHPDELERARSDAAHIAANSPDVTLRLVAIARAALAWILARDAHTLAYTEWSEGAIDDAACCAAESVVTQAEEALDAVLRGKP